MRSRSSTQEVQGMQRESKMKLMELKHKAAIALPYFPTDNSRSLDVVLFLQTMNASGGNGVHGLVGYIMKFVLNVGNGFSHRFRKVKFGICLGETK